VQREHQTEVAASALPMNRQDAVEDPVVSVHDIGPFQVQDPCEAPHGDRIGEGQVMLAFTCVNTRQAHRHRAEPVHTHPRREHFSGGRPRDVLGRDGDLVPTRGEDISEVEYMPFLAADIRRKELRSEQNTHQMVLLLKRQDMAKRTRV
jgi:hypothetical protein